MSFTKAARAEYQNKRNYTLPLCLFLPKRTAAECQALRIKNENQAKGESGAVPKVSKINAVAKTSKISAEPKVYQSMPRVE